MNANERDKLIEAYIPLAKSIANSYDTLPRDEARSEALLGLVIAAHNFDEERGAYFPPFARAVITNRLNSVFNKAVATNHIRHELDDGVMADVERINTIDTGYLILKMSIAEAIECLNKNNRKVFRMMIRGYTQSEIAEALEISQPTVSRIVNQLREIVSKECV